MEQTPIDRILMVMAGESYREEVTRARDCFFEQLKDLREDDPSYESLTSCFLNWYVFDRPMESGLGTPLQVYTQETELSPKEKATCAAMAANIHSLFEIIRLEAGGVTLKDLFTTELIRVSERRQTAGLRRGDILEARLVPVAGRMVFAPGAFVLHPRPARKLVCQAIQQARKRGFPPPAELIARLQALNFRFVDRFRERVPLEKVYAEILSFIANEPSKPESEP